MLLGAFRGIFTVFMLGSTALLVNALQMVSLVFRPFSRPLFRRINRLLAGTWWKFCVLFTLYFYRVEFVYSGDETPVGESVLLICNHQAFPDILALMPLADRCGRLPDMKWYVKESIKYMPGIGWGMLFIDCIFLKRNWTADAGKIRATFQELVESGIPFWMMSFSEGTRLTPAKLKRSQEFARKAGLPLTQNVMLPRTRGFTASVEGLGSRAQAVYDVTLAYEPRVVTLWGFFTGKVRRFHLDVRRFALKDLPKEEPALAQWLTERFLEKDRKLLYFKENQRLI